MAIIDFLRRLNAFAPENPINIPPPVTPRIPTPIPQTDSPVLQSYISHIKNFPTYEPPGKLRRIAGLLTGIGEGLKSGPLQGYEATRSVIDEPYTRSIEEWQKRAAELKNAATVEGQSYTNLAKLMQGERKLDLEEQKITDARTRAQQNLEIARQRAATLGMEIVPGQDGLYAINKLTGQTQKLDVDIYTKPEEFADKFKQAIAVADMYTSAYRDRTAAMERLGNLRASLDAPNANVALERYIDELATRDLAAANPDLVGTVIGYVDGRLQLVPQSSPAWYNIFGQDASQAYAAAKQKLDELRAQYKMRYGNLAGLPGIQQPQLNIPQQQPNIPQQQPKPQPKQPQQSLGGYDFTKKPSLAAVRKKYPDEQIERIDFHPLEGWIALGKNGWFRIE